MVLIMAIRPNQYFCNCLSTDFTRDDGFMPIASAILNKVRRVGVFDSSFHLADIGRM